MGFHGVLGVYLESWHQYHVHQHPDPFEQFPLPHTEDILSVVDFWRAVAEEKRRRSGDAEVALWTFMA